MRNLWIEINMITGKLGSISHVVFNLDLRIFMFYTKHTPLKFSMNLKQNKQNKYNLLTRTAYVKS